MNLDKDTGAVSDAGYWFLHQMKIVNGMIYGIDNNGRILKGSSSDQLAFIDGGSIQEITNIVFGVALYPDFTVTTDNSVFTTGVNYSSMGLDIDGVRYFPVGGVDVDFTNKNGFAKGYVKYLIPSKDITDNGLGDIVESSILKVGVQSTQAQSVSYNGLLISSIANLRVNEMQLSDSGNVISKNIFNSNEKNVGLYTYNGAQEGVGVSMSMHRANRNAYWYDMHNVTYMKFGATTSSFGAASGSLKLLRYNEQYYSNRNISEFVKCGVQSADDGLGYSIKMIVEGTGDAESPQGYAFIIGNLTCKNRDNPTIEQKGIVKINLLTNKLDERFITGSMTSQELSTQTQSIPSAVWDGSRLVIGLNTSNNNATKVNGVTSGFNGMVSINPVSGGVSGTFYNDNELVTAQIIKMRTFQDQNGSYKIIALGNFADQYPSTIKHQGIRIFNSDGSKSSWSSGLSFGGIFNSNTDVEILNSADGLPNRMLIVGQGLRFDSSYPNGILMFDLDSGAVNQAKMNQLFGTGFLDNESGSVVFDQYFNNIYLYGQFTKFNNKWRHDIIRINY